MKQPQSKKTDEQSNAFLTKMTKVILYFKFNIN